MYFSVSFTKSFRKPVSGYLFFRNACFELPDRKLYVGLFYLERAWKFPKY